MRQRVQHGLVGHGVSVGAQFREFVAERLRQNLRTHGQDLADLDEGGAKRFEHETHVDRRQPMNRIKLVSDPDDLLETLESASPSEMVFFGEVVFSAAEQADFLVDMVGCGVWGLQLGIIVCERGVVGRCSAVGTAVGTG